MNSFSGLPFAGPGRGEPQSASPSTFTLGNMEKPKSALAELDLNERSRLEPPQNHLCRRALFQWKSL